MNIRAELFVYDDQAQISFFPQSHEEVAVLQELLAKRELFLDTYCPERRGKTVYQLTEKNIEEGLCVILNFF